MAVLTVSVLIYLNHLEYPQRQSLDEILTRLAMIFALGIPIFLTIQVLIEGIKGRKGFGLAAHFLGIILLGFYYRYMLKDFEMVAITRYIALTLALYLSFVVMPYFKRKEGFELYVIRLLVDFCITYFYAMILYLGLAAILLTINLLFSANIPTKVLLDIWVIVVGVFGPAYFFSGIPAYDEVLSQDQYPRVFQVLLNFIVMPLLVVYGGILYLYIIKTVMERQWPIQMISHLILWFAIISTLVLLAIYPLRLNNQWFKGFVNWFPKGLLPLVVMLFISMGMRIGDYGVTENRYFVVAGGLWIMISMLYLVFRRKQARPIVIAISLSAIMVLSVLGPWSAYSVSRYSQNQRLIGFLETWQMLEDRKLIRPNDNVSLEDRREISSILDYFKRNHSLTQVTVLPKDFQLSDMDRLMGFPYEDSYGYVNDRKYYSYRLETDPDILTVRDYDYLISFQYFGGEKNSSSQEGELRYDYSNDRLKVLNIENVIYEKDLTEIVDEIHRQNLGNVVLSRDKMSYWDENERVKVELLFKEIGIVQNQSSETWKIDHVSFHLFIKMK
ncbi:hypothetical protein JCM11672_23550 [Alkaliphilus crotonatoxidans]